MSASAPLLGKREHLGEDIRCCHTRGVESLRLGRPGGKRGGVFCATSELDAYGIKGDLANNSGALKEPRDFISKRIRIGGAYKASARLNGLQSMCRTADTSDSLLVKCSLKGQTRGQSLRRYKTLRKRDNTGP